MRLHGIIYRRCEWNVPGTLRNGNKSNLHFIRSLQEYVLFLIGHRLFFIIACFIHEMIISESVVDSRSLCCCEERWNRIDIYSIHIQVAGMNCLTFYKEYVCLVITSDLGAKNTFFHHSLVGTGNISSTYSYMVCIIEAVHWDSQQ